MNACGFENSGAIELYFYGELEPGAAAVLEAHIRDCGPCRQHLDDLRAIRVALAASPRVDAPPAGDWSGFTRRLEGAIRWPAPALRRRSIVGWAAMAATLAVVTSAVFVTSRVRHSTPAQTRIVASDAAGTAARSGVQEVSPSAVADRSLVQHSEEHFERSKLVVLGLATLDPRRTHAADWQHERELAGSLLPDTRLYRLTAEERGLTDLARVLGDLETVLLETSMSEHADPEALERVQHLIARRDLVVKMNVVGSGI